MESTGIGGESEKVITPQDVLESLMSDGTMDAMRLKIIRRLKSMEDLKTTTIAMVDHSKVLNTPGAEKQTKRQLFDALRHELEAPALEKASKLVWELILDNDGLGKEINQTVEKVFSQLSARQPPLFPQPCQDQLKQKESLEKEKQGEQIEQADSTHPPSTPLDSVPDPRNVTASCGKIFEAEFRRCIRADGKNWRCANSCVLDSKYCERHQNVLKSKKPKKSSKINNLGALSNNVVDGSSKTNDNDKSSRTKRKGSPEEEVSLKRLRRLRKSALKTDIGE